MFSTSYLDLAMLNTSNNYNMVPSLALCSSSSASSSSSVSSSSVAASPVSVVAPKKKKSKSPCKAKTPLPLDFQPTVYTVLCGRSRECFESVGNRNFRILCSKYLQEYTEAPGKLEKSRIVTKIMKTIRQSSPVGAFVSFENGRYYEVSQRTAREKVGAFFRDSLHTVYRSSAKAKLARKRAESPDDAPPSADTILAPQTRDDLASTSDDNIEFPLDIIDMSLLECIAPVEADSNVDGRFSILGAAAFSEQAPKTTSNDDIIDMSLLECIAPVESANLDDGNYNFMGASFFDVEGL